MLFPIYCDCEMPPLLHTCFPRLFRYASLRIAPPSPQELWDPKVKGTKEEAARKEQAAAAAAAASEGGCESGGQKQMPKQQQGGGSGDGGEKVKEGEAEEEAPAPARPPSFPALLTTRALAALSPPGETVELLGGGPGLGFVAAMTDKQRLYLFALS